MNLDLRRLFQIRDNYGRLNLPFVATLGVVILATIIIISLVAINSQKYHYDKNMTYVDNVSTYASYMDFGAREEMYLALNSALRENGVKQPPYQGALIREGTYQQGALAPDQYTSRFIIDVPEVEQSYQAYLVWTGIDSFRAFGYFVLLSCVDEDQKIYENFTCQEPTPLNPEEAAKATNYFPYTKTEDGAATFTIVEEDNTIELRLRACDDQKLAQQYEKDAREWLKNETRLNLDEFEITVSNYCDGAAI